MLTGKNRVSQYFGSHSTAYVTGVHPFCGKEPRGKTTSSGNPNCLNNCELSIVRIQFTNEVAGRIKADSHIAYRSHAVPLPCRTAKGLECVFPILFTQFGRV